MYSNDILTTIADKDGAISIKSARAILKELNKANVALRRINFLSETYNRGNPHLQEIAQISGEVLNNEGLLKHDK